MRFFALVFVTPVVSIALGACASDGADGTPNPDAGADAAMDARLDARMDTGRDANFPRNPQAWCTALRAKQTSCDGAVECGGKFGEWCNLQAATNSYAFEKADTACLSNCVSDDRSACRYAAYSQADLSETQLSFAAAYCDTCGASDKPGCLNALYTYNAAAGPKKVSDAYVAVWELSDAILAEMKARCTGTALNQGADCPTAFTTCVTDIYLNAMPNCP